jgi:hypothetical protein
LVLDREHDFLLRLLTPLAPLGERPREVVERRADLMYVLSDQDAEPRRWLPPYLDPEDVPAMFSLDFTDGSVGIGVKERPQFAVEGVQMVLCPRQFG